MGSDFDGDPSWPQRAKLLKHPSLRSRDLTFPQSLTPTIQWRRLVPNRIDNWSLTSLRQRLVKTGGRLVKHARYYWLLLAESHLARRLFGSMVRRIAALPVPAG
jgi:hypothetical protein